MLREPNLDFLVAEGGSCHQRKYWSQREARARVCAVGLRCACTRAPTRSRTRARTHAHRTSGAREMCHT
eukprot:6198630-Pleurochrysis_carterae.AAC.6